MPTYGPVTGAQLQNEIGVTLQAQQDFENAVGQLNSIHSDVTTSQQQLTAAAMATTAGQALGNVLQRWGEDFQDITGVLNWMAGQLGHTAQLLQQGNQQSADMANSIRIPGFGSFGFH